MMAVQLRLARKPKLRPTQQVTMITTGITTPAVETAGMLTGCGTPDGSTPSSTARRVSVKTSVRSKIFGSPKPVSCTDNCDEKLSRTFDNSHCDAFFSSFVAEAADILKA